MTTKDLIAEHNELARKLDQAELTAGWKAGKDKLQARIDAMRGLVAVDAKLDAEEAQETSDPLAIDPLDQGAPEEPSATEADEAEVSAAEPTTDEHSDETEARGSIGQMVAELLVDAEGYDYQEIVDIVRGQFPSAKTSKRSIASVAAGLRRKGIEVPMRRKAKT
jgi:hypothetical protein